MDSERQNNVEATVGTSENINVDKKLMYQLVECLKSGYTESYARAQFNISTIEFDQLLDEYYKEKDLEIERLKYEHQLLLNRQKLLDNERDEFELITLLEDISTSQLNVTYNEPVNSNHGDLYHSNINKEPKPDYPDEEKKLIHRFNDF